VGRGTGLRRGGASQKNTAVRPPPSQKPQPWLGKQNETASQIDPTCLIFIGQVEFRTEEKEPVEIVIACPVSAIPRRIKRHQNRLTAQAIGIGKRITIGFQRPKSDKEPGIVKPPRRRDCPVSHEGLEAASGLGGQGDGGGDQLANTKRPIGGITAQRDIVQPQRRCRDRSVDQAFAIDLLTGGNPAPAIPEAGFGKACILVDLGDKITGYWITSDR
jgi:hypothetical protein